MPTPTQTQTQTPTSALIQIKLSNLLAIMRIGQHGIWLVCFFSISSSPGFFFISFLSSPLHSSAISLISVKLTTWLPLQNTDEHHIANFDPGAFFTLHDYDSSGSWTPEEIRRTYGLDDESSRGVPPGKKQDVIRDVLDIFDESGDGVVSWDEWIQGWRKGKRLPDFGVGLMLFFFSLSSFFDGWWAGWWAGWGGGDVGGWYECCSGREKKGIGIDLG